MFGYNPLTALIVLPFLIGLVCLAVPNRIRIAAKAAAFLTSCAALYLAFKVFISRPVVLNYGSYNILAADNLSGFMALAIAFFGVIVSLYSIGYVDKRCGLYFGGLLITLASALGAVYANDLILLVVFWGILAITLYLLVVIRGGDGAYKAAKKSLIIVGGTDALMILGVALISSLAGSLAMDRIHLDMRQGGLVALAYLLIMIAGFAKAGAIPLHSWLPDACEFAPAPVAAYLPGSLDKLLGIYLIARMSLDVFVMNVISSTLLAAIGAVTIILAVLIALVQHDLKRLLGYHAISQVGYMLLGIGTGNAVGIAGGLFHMLNNAVYKSCLFLCGGNVEKRTGTTDLDKLGGLAGYMPVTFLAFLVASLSISGIPPFNGFASKWMIYQGIIESASPHNPLWILWLAAAMFGSALTVASFMKLLHAVFLGRAHRDFKDIREAAPSMVLPVAVLASICVLFGVFAFGLPLKIFILPALKQPLLYIGTWDPKIATALILAGAVIGIMFYYLFNRRAFRTTEVFIGGGAPADSLGRISGTDFYNTIKEETPLKALYAKDASGVLDIYNLGRGITRYFTVMLERLHNGVLSTYMVWCLLGMMAIFLFLFIR